jgi:hypothetical protein
VLFVHAVDQHGLSRPVVREEIAVRPRHLIEQLLEDHAGSHPARGSLLRIEPILVLSVAEHQGWHGLLVVDDELESIDAR